MALIPVQIVLLVLAAACLLVARPVLEGLPIRREVDEVRRLWRKQAPVHGRGLLAHAAALILGLDAAACLLVPVAGLELPFADLPFIFGLLTTGRLAAALIAIEWGGPPGGTTAALTARLLPGAAAAMALATITVAGLGGGATLIPAALIALRDSGGWSSSLPLLLSAGAVAILARMDSGLPGPEIFAGGRALALLRLARVLRRLAWLDLVAVLLPPLPGAGFWLGVAAWASKLAGLAALDILWRGRPVQPPGLANLAALLALLAALLLVLRGPIA